MPKNKNKHLKPPKISACIEPVLLPVDWKDLTSDLAPNFIQFGINQFMPLLIKLENTWGNYEIEGRYNLPYAKLIGVGFYFNQLIRNIEKKYPEQEALLNKIKQIANIVMHYCYICRAEIHHVNLSNALKASKGKFKSVQSIKNNCSMLIERILNLYLLAAKIITNEEVFIFLENNNAVLMVASQTPEVFHGTLYARISAQALSLISLTYQLKLNLSDTLNILERHANQFIKHLDPNSYFFSSFNFIYVAGQADILCSKQQYKEALNKYKQITNYIKKTNQPLINKSDGVQSAFLFANMNTINIRLTFIEKLMYSDRYHLKEHAILIDFHFKNIFECIAQINKLLSDAINTVPEKVFNINLKTYFKTCFQQFYRSLLNTLYLNCAIAFLSFKLNDRLSQYTRVLEKKALFIEVCKTFTSFNSTLQLDIPEIDEIIKLLVYYSKKAKLMEKKLRKKNWRMYITQADFKSANAAFNELMEESRLQERENLKKNSTSKAKKNNNVTKDDDTESQEEEMPESPSETIQELSPYKRALFEARQFISTGEYQEAEEKFKEMAEVSKQASLLEDYLFAITEQANCIKLSAFSYLRRKDFGSYLKVMKRSVNVLKKISKHPFFLSKKSESDVHYNFNLVYTECLELHSKCDRHLKEEYRNKLAGRRIAKYHYERDIGPWAANLNPKNDKAIELSKIQGLLQSSEDLKKRLGNIKGDLKANQHDAEKPQDFNAFFCTGSAEKSFKLLFKGKGQRLKKYVPYFNGNLYRQDKFEHEAFYYSICRQLHEIDLNIKLFDPDTITTLCHFVFLWDIVRKQYKEVIENSQQDDDLLHKKFSTRINVIMHILKRIGFECSVSKDQCVEIAARLSRYVMEPCMPNIVEQLFSEQQYEPVITNIPPRPTIFRRHSFSGTPSPKVEPSPFEEHAPRRFPAVEPM